MINKKFLIVISVLTISVTALATPKEFEYHNFWQSFDKAQTEFLKGSLSRSRVLFSQLFEDYSEFSNLPSREKNLIFYSSLRAAQLTSNPKLKEQHLLNAVKFDAKLSPDPVIFPPDFISKFQKVSRKTRSASLSSYRPIRKASKSMKNEPRAENLSLPKSTGSKKWFTDKKTLFWISVLGASVYAGYRVYEHNNQKSSMRNLVVPTTEIKSF